MPLEQCRNGQIVVDLESLVRFFEARGLVRLPVGTIVASAFVDGVQVGINLKVPASNTDGQLFVPKMSRGRPLPVVIDFANVDLRASTALEVPKK